MSQKCFNNQIFRIFFELDDLENGLKLGVKTLKTP